MHVSTFFLKLFDRFHTFGDGILVALVRRSVITLIDGQVILLNRMLVEIMGVFVCDVKSLTPNRFDVYVFEVFGNRHDPP